eukprot:UN20346
MIPSTIMCTFAWISNTGTISQDGFCDYIINIRGC